MKTGTECVPSSVAVVVDQERLGDVLVAREEPLAVAIALAECLAKVAPVERLGPRRRLRPLLDVLAERLREHGDERPPSALLDRRDPLRDRGALGRRRHCAVHGDAREGAVERERARRLPRGVRLGHRRGEARVDRAEHLLVEVHQRLVRGVRLIEFEDRELRVVPRADALVAVAAANLVDALEPADDEALEIELRRNAHEEAHVEGVVVGDEWLRRRAADERVHRRRLDLEEPGLVQDRADGAHDVAARTEHVGHGRVRDQIDVALPVAQLDVRQAVPLLRERPHRLRDETQRARRDRELAALARRERALGLDDVADVELGEALVRGAERRLADEELDLPRAVAHAEERQTPGRSKRDDPPAHVEQGAARRRVHRRFLVTAARVLHRRRDRARLRDVDRAPAEPRARVVGERVVAAIAHRGRLVAAGFDDRVFRGGALAFVGHRASGASASSVTPPLRSVPPAAASRYDSMNGSRSPSSTASTFPFWCDVRRSFTRRYGCRT